MTFLDMACTLSPIVIIWEWILTWSAYATVG